MWERVADLDNSVEVKVTSSCVHGCQLPHLLHLYPCMDSAVSMGSLILPMDSAWSRAVIFSDEAMHACMTAWYLEIGYNNRIV